MSLPATTVLFDLQLFIFFVNLLSIIIYLQLMISSYTAYIKIYEQGMY